MVVKHHDLVDLAVTLHTKTAKAWLVESETSSPKRVWFPRQWGELETTGDPVRKQAVLTAPQDKLEFKGLV